MPSNTIPIDCPVGEKDCTAIREIIRLQQEVEALKTLVHTDTLTGLPNLRHFRQMLELEMERTRRSELTTTLIVLDIDHFKNVNDTWGHEVGNKALKHAATCIERSLRKTDIPCRYGGEEFAIILAQTGFQSGLVIAERLRQGLESHPLRIESDTLTLTASLGVAPFDSHDTLTPRALVEIADAYMYQAKEAGRNCVRHPPLREIGAGTEISKDERDDLTHLFNTTSHRNTKE